MDGADATVYTVQYVCCLCDAHTKRPKIKHPREKTSQGQHVPRDKTSQGTKCPRDKMSQGTKRPKGTNEAHYL